MTIALWVVGSLFAVWLVAQIISAVVTILAVNAVCKEAQLEDE